MTATRSGSRPEVASAPGAVRTLGYRPALDGLRAVAVVAVLLFHENIGLGRATGVLPGGFLGVDVFFVLSGFLITSILLAHRAKDGHTVSRESGVRRARRLLPALFLLIALTALYAAFVAPASDLGAIRRQGISSLFYVENWSAIATRTGQITPLSHTWSLSIEEQWYLIWPLLLTGLLVITRARPRRLVAGIVVLAAASCALMLALAGPGNYQRVAAGTDTRVWQLLLGALLAVVMVRGRGLAVRTQRARVVVEALAIVGLGIFAWMVLTVRVTDGWAATGAPIVAALASMAVIVAAVQERGGVVRPALAWRPLVAIGLISYGLYLYHLLVYLWLTPDRVGFGGAGLLALRLAVVAALAVASYRLVERPIRGGRVGLARSLPAFVVALVTVGALLIVATAGAVAPTVDVSQHYRDLARTTPAGATRALVAGDASAVDLAFQVPAPWDHDGIRGTVVGGCGIVDGSPTVHGVTVSMPTCPPWRDAFRGAVDAFRPRVVTLMTGDAELLDQRTDGDLLRTGTRPWARDLERRLEDARRILTARGATLVLTTVPSADPGPPRVPAAASARRDPARLAAVNGVWRKFAAAHRDVVVADLGRLLCPAGNAHARIGPYDLRPDGVRLSPSGAAVVWRWLAPIVHAAAGRGGAR